MKAFEIAEQIARDASCAQGEFNARVLAIIPYLTEHTDEIERLRGELAEVTRMMTGPGSADWIGENRRLRAALNKLVTTLTAVENSPSFQGIWPYLHAHGYKYQGPDWRDALADARLAIAHHEQNGDGT